MSASALCVGSRGKIVYVLHPLASLERVSRCSVSRAGLAGLTRTWMGLRGWLTEAGRARAFCGRWGLVISQSEIE